MIRFTLLCLLAGASAASAADVAGPVSGYVAGADASIRVLRGLPGSAHSVRIAVEGFTALSISARAGVAFGCTSEGLAEARLSTGEVRVLSADCPDAVRFSPTGTVAVAIYRGTGKVLRIGGAAVDFAARDCAISDDGQTMLCAAANEDSLWRLDSGGSRSVYPAAVAAMTFVPRSHDAVIATGTEVLTLAAAGTAAPLTSFPGTTALAVSDDGRTIYAAGGEGRKILRISADGQQLLSIDAPVETKRLEQMTADRVFRIGDGAAPVWLLDDSGTEPAIVFVPAAEASHE